MFFLLAKVLWFLLQPSSLMIAAVMAGAALAATRWCRLGRKLLWSGSLALLICGLTPLGDVLIRPLETRFPRPALTPEMPVAGIIVLGGAEDGHADGSPQLAALNEAAERYTEAVALVRRLPAARLVFSGGSGAVLAASAPEAETAARLFEALGVPRERITLEPASRDTYENALFTARILNPKPGERWLLVTSAWHMPRAIGCFRRAGFTIEAWPVDYRTPGRLQPLRFHSSMPEGLRRIDFIAKEYLGLVIYYLAGRTEELLPAP
ncbi:MAG: YdcF family protein [Hyphomicrobiaceae bacterium]|nr:YdcF family protein [Hyphomicrobiaceae bacterium]